jgi:EAL domain-containing protein (putative c-di-GMP-specific phosphodiesterase class I)/ActR/RegA family two-component response regulator
MGQRGTSWAFRDLREARNGEGGMPVSLLENVRNWFRPADHGEDATLAPLHADHVGSASPRAFVVDDEEGLCKLITMTLSTLGVESETFHNARDAVAALDRQLPAIIFLDVALEKSDAIDVIRGLGERGYGGIVQLMSGSNVELLEDVRRIGARHGLNMWPPLSKPFRTEQVRHIISSAHLAESAHFTVGLDEALAKNWLELWYQPKIDLRSKRLAGAEGLIRCRHPLHGILPPASFLPGAAESSHAALTEHVIATALRDWDEIAETGVHLHTAVNTSIGALANLQLPALIREHRSKNADWPGLILEITESEVIKDVALMHEISTQLRIYGITFAIDDFGEGFSSFARLRELPFVELKLDRSFVKGSGADPRNAGICQTIINLAHNFGALAVAEGLESAADLQAMYRMRCDIGQGFYLARPMPKANLVALLEQRVLQEQG